MKYTIEQLDELSNRQLEEIAHELTGKCSHKFRVIDSRWQCSKCFQEPPSDATQTQLLSREYDAILSYTTDFNDAFELVAFAESKGFQFDLHDNTSQFYPRQADVVVYKKNSEIPKVITIAFILALSNYRKKG